VAAMGADTGGLVTGGATDAGGAAETTGATGVLLQAPSKMAVHRAAVAASRLESFIVFLRELKSASMGRPQQSCPFGLFPGKLRRNLNYVATLAPCWVRTIGRWIARKAIAKTMRLKKRLRFCTLPCGSCGAPNDCTCNDPVRM